MTNAINFNWFYHNNCKEFQGIKNRIWECNNPTEKQLAEWREEHWWGPYSEGQPPDEYFYSDVCADIVKIKKRFDEYNDDFVYASDYYTLTECAFDEMYSTCNCAPWLKG